RLRAASTPDDARPWIQPFPKLPILAVASLPLILFSGIYMVRLLAVQDQAWPHVAGAALVLMAPFGVISQRRLRSIRNSFSGGNAADMLGKLRDPLLKASLGVRVATFLGVFLLVSLKPGLWPSIGLVATSMAIGVLPTLRRRA